MAKRTTEEALKVLKELEPDYKFRFENGYKSAKTKNLHVICNHGHEYLSSYNNFANKKRRCNQCANEKKCINNKQKYTEEEALKTLKELEPSYSFRFENGYRNCKDKNLHVTCSNKHQYITRYSDFKQGYRCPKCSNKYKPSTEEAIKNLKEMDNESSFYFKDGYKGCMVKNLIVTCSKNHEYTTRYNDFQQGHRCPHCINIKSKPETEIIDFIKTFYSKDIQQSNRTLIKNIHSNRNLELDIYLPDIKVALEFNGVYWHSDEVIKEQKIGFTSAKEYHEYKSQACNQLGIHLIHIEEQDYIDNKTKLLESIKNKIQHYI